MTRAGVEDVRKRAIKALSGYQPGWPERSCVELADALEEAWRQLADEKAHAERCRLSALESMRQASVAKNELEQVREQARAQLATARALLGDMERQARQGAEHAEQNGDGERTQLTLLSLAGWAHMALAAIDAKGKS